MYGTYVRVTYKRRRRRSEASCVVNIVRPKPNRTEPKQWRMNEISVLFDSLMEALVPASAPGLVSPPTHGANPNSVCLSVCRTSFLKGMSTSLATSVSSDFAYTACYCEENVYLVCQQLCRSGKASIDASDLFVVFISNSDKKVPIWHQKAGLSGKDGFVIWDYHVICIQIFSESNTETLVWDLDTTLELPESFSKYMQESFRPSLDLHPSYQRLYRVVPAPLFLRYFSSDRRHMKTPEGLWAMPPPPYECIHGLGVSVHNLDEYITMSNKDIRSSMDLTKEHISGEMFGVVVDHEGLKELFS